MEDWKEYSEDYFRRVVDSFWEAYRADFENAMRNDTEKSIEESEDDLNNNASKIHIQDSQFQTKKSQMASHSADVGSQTKRRGHQSG